MGDSDYGQKYKTGGTAFKAYKVPASAAKNTIRPTTIGVSLEWQSRRALSCVTRGE